MMMTNASVCVFSRLRVFVSVSLCLLSGALTGCTPPDQRLFNPNAGKPPKPYIPPAPPGKPAPAPFLQIVAGTPQEEWAPAVERSTKRALARKPSVLFVVSALSPEVRSPTEQVNALKALVAQDAQAVAERIIASGAPSTQVQIEAKTDTSSPKASIRVDLR